MMRSTAADGRPDETEKGQGGMLVGAQQRLQKIIGARCSKLVPFIRAQPRRRASLPARLTRAWVVVADVACWQNQRTRKGEMLGCGHSLTSDERIDRQFTSSQCARGEMENRIRSRWPVATGSNRRVEGPRLRLYFSALASRMVEALA